MSPIKKTRNLNIRLSDDDIKLLDNLCVMYGLDKTTMVVNSLRNTYETRPKFVISPTEPVTNSIGIVAATDPASPKNSL